MTHPHSTKKALYISNFMTLFFNLLSFLLYTFLLDDYHGASIMIIGLKVGITLILITNIYVVYNSVTIPKKKYTKTLLKFLIYFDEFTPFVEILIFINIDLYIYQNMDFFSWIVLFRIGNFLIKNLLFLRGNYPLNKINRCNFSNFVYRIVKY